MNTQQLYTKVTQGFSWNALLYSVHKGTTTIVIMLLYTIFPTAIFSMYSNINSITFLLLLWLDFGLHKTIPLFALKYAQNRESLSTFIKRILLFKILLLFASVPIYLMLIKTIIDTLQLQDYYLLPYASCLFFITEGILGVVKLIYHAYFLHSIYNKISTLVLLCELLINIAAIHFLPADYTLLLVLFISKITTNCLLLSIVWGKKNLIYQLAGSTHPIEKTTIDKQFFIHATLMYINTNIKSLSERNFLLPLFTVTFGPAMANMFKVANDGALFFYRIVVKTIGTLDTSLFSYTLNTHLHNKTWQFAITRLTHKIAALVIPFLGITYVIYNNKHIINYDLIMFNMFLIISLELLIEILFSPFERVLEVKKEYFLLACAYTPYIFVMCLLIFTPAMTYIGIVNTLLLIHGVRLVSTLIMTCIVYTKYAYTFPFYFIMMLIGLVIPCAYIMQPLIERIILSFLSFL